MATSLVTFQSFPISCSTTSTKSSTTHSQRRSTHSFTGWLTPIFGWSTDYIDSKSSSSSGSSSISGRDEVAAESGEERKGWRYVAGGFTEEKARQLRMMTTQMEMSHERMYHSAIASRLASDFSHRFLDDSSSY